MFSEGTAREDVGALYKQSEHVMTIRLARVFSTKCLRFELIKFFELATSRSELKFWRRVFVHKKLTVWTGTLESMPHERMSVPSTSKLNMRSTCLAGVFLYKRLTVRSERDELLPLDGKSVFFACEALFCF